MEKAKGKISRSLRNDTFQTPNLGEVDQKSSSVKKLR